jgi:DNA (cytosine-5)-methyltransferase 1
LTLDPIGIDLFAGAGGLSYGLSQAGFNIKLGVEIDSNAALTLKKNHKKMNVIVSDIRSLDPILMLKQAGINPEELLIIAGGPPCRGFSRSNLRNRFLENPLNSLYKEFFRFIKILNPPIFLFENVEGLKTLANGIIFHDIHNLGKKYGYNTQSFILKAEDFGVPQRRKRIIFTGTKLNNFELKFKKKKKVTVREALDDLPVLLNGNSIDSMDYSKNENLSSYQKKMRKANGNYVTNNLVTQNSRLVIERYNHIPQGGNWKKIPINLMTNYKNLKNCHGWIYYRLKWDEPSIVISNFRKNMLIHPEQNRGLSVREAARLQSFPDNYIFYGTLSSQQQQIANAVPPLLSKEIGINLLKIVGDIS